MQPTLTLKVSGSPMFMSLSSGNLQFLSLCLSHTRLLSSSPPNSTLMFLSSFGSIGVWVRRYCGAPAELGSRSIHQRHGGLSPGGSHWIQCDLLSPASVHGSKRLDCQPPAAAALSQLYHRFTLSMHSRIASFIWLYFRILEVSLTLLA